ncbi:MAG: hypothetical protein OEW19_08415, partial [Acidobacteriota bacterium]|nr:hypothetical protein [Acidobacteriota bacterium]
MRQQFARSIAVGLLAALPTAWVAFGSRAAASAPPAKATVAVHSESSTYAPGDTVAIEILVEVAPGWHVNSNTPTYDYLIPTVAEVELPPGWPP